MAKGSSALAGLMGAITALAPFMRRPIAIHNATNASKQVVTRPRQVHLPKKKTVTKANVQRNNRILRGATGLITQSKFSARKPASRQVKTMEMIVPTKVYTNNYPIQLGTFAGFQNAATDMNLGYATVSSLTSLLPPELSASQQGSTRLVIKGYDKCYTMTNNTNATVELDIYDIAMKNDVPLSQQVVSNGSFYTLSPGDPWTYWKQGCLASEGAATGVTPTPAEFLGCIPSDSSFFKDYFKVLKKQTIHMPLGSGHRHYVNLTPNWLVTEGIATSTRYQGWAGHTIYCMFVLRGFPVSDDANISVTSSSGTVAIVASERARYCFVTDNRQSGYYLDGLTSPAAGNQQFINAASGAVSTLDQV